MKPQSLFDPGPGGPASEREEERWGGRAGAPRTGGTRGMGGMPPRGTLRSGAWPGAGSASRGRPDPKRWGQARPGPARPGRGWPDGPRWPRGPRAVPAWGAGAVFTPPDADVPAAGGSEQVRWAQDCLNQLLGLQLRLDGVLAADGRSALRRFQSRNGLRPTGLLGPDSVEALGRACNEAPAGEIPPEVHAVLGAMPGVPAYRRAGTLADAHLQRQVQGPALYLLAFQAADGSRRRAYSGQTDDIRRRLLQHRLCAHMLGQPGARYEVWIAPAPRMTPDARRAAERGLHERMRAHRGVLTNQRLELEQELLGHEWH